MTVNDLFAEIGRTAAFARPNGIYDKYSKVDGSLVTAGFIPSCSRAPITTRPASTKKALVCVPHPFV